jgi:cysteinyl-tRNA synthetase
LSAHYRTTLEFSEDVLEQAQGALKRIDEFVFRLDPDQENAEDVGTLEQLKTDIYRYLDDDFDTPRTFAALFEFIRVQNTKNRPGGQHTYQLFQTLNGLFDIMNFETQTPDQKIEALIAERERYRTEKQFAKADTIRDQLKAMGIQLYDTKEGVKWRQV